MSKERNIKININAAGYGTVEVDGREIPHLKGFDVRGRAGELTEVTLHYNLYQVDMDSDGFVQYNPKDAANLIALGWTPPA